MVDWSEFPLADEGPAAAPPGAQPVQPARPVATGGGSEWAQFPTPEEYAEQQDIAGRSAISRGFSGGLRSLGSIGGGFLAASADVIKDIGSSLEVDFLEKSGGDLQKYAIGLVQDYQAEAAKYLGRSPSLEEVFESDQMFEDFLTWLGTNVGQGAATTIPALASFLVNPALGWGVIYGMGVGEAYGEQLTENAYEDASASIAFAAGVPYAMAERAFGAGAHLAGALRRGGSTAAKTFLGRLAKELPLTMAGEATAEALQEAITMGAAGLEAGRPIDEIYTWEALKRIGEAGAAGAAAGGPFGVVSAIPKGRGAAEPAEPGETVPREPAEGQPVPPAAGPVSGAPGEGAPPGAPTAPPEAFDPETGISTVAPPVEEEEGVEGIPETPPGPVEPPPFVRHDVREGERRPIQPVRGVPGPPFEPRPLAPEPEPAYTPGVTEPALPVPPEPIPVPEAAAPPTAASPSPVPPSKIGGELAGTTDEDIDDLISESLSGVRKDPGETAAEKTMARKPWEYSRDEVRRMEPDQVSELFWKPAAERIYRLAGSKQLQRISDYYADRYDIPRLKIEKTKEPIKTVEGGVSITHGQVQYSRNEAGKITGARLFISDTMSDEEAVITLRHEIEHLIDLVGGYETDVANAIQVTTDESGKRILEVVPGHHRYFEVFNYDYPHRIAIRDALESGKEVSPEILREWPELLEQIKERQKPAEEPSAEEPPGRGPGSGWGTPEDPNIVLMAEYFARNIKGGTDYSRLGIVGVRKEISQVMGFKPKNDAIDEAFELGTVMATRDFLAKEAGGLQDVEVFERLVDRYNHQPILGTRTSTSVEKQQYSTPLPLAHLVSFLAGVTKQGNVLEPTAGNGALLIDAAPGNTFANELDPRRAANLEALGFEVSRDDALNAPWRAQDFKADSVVMNPPFGKVFDDAGNPRLLDVPYGKTQEVDHAIALKALAAMKPRTGKAVLILGSKSGREAGTTNAYGGRTHAAFYRYLYDQYNVVDHFVVAGDLYARQGTKFPVDVIVIDTVGRSELVYPHGKLPPIFTTWEELKALYDGKPANQSRREDVAGGARPRPAPGGRPGPEPAPGQPEGVGVPRPAGGAPAPADTGRPERGEPPAPVPGERPGGAPGPARPPEAPVGERPAAPVPAGPERPGGLRPPEGERAPEAEAPEPGGGPGRVAGVGEGRPEVSPEDAIDDLFGEFEKNVKSEEIVEQPDSEDLYAKLKERLTFAYERGVAEGWSLKEFVEKVMTQAKTRYEGDRLEAFGAVLGRFLKEVRDGRIDVGVATGEQEAEVDEADQMVERARKAAAAAKEARETQFQVKYVPVSGRGSVDTLVPKNHLTSIYRAQQNLVSRLRRMPAYKDVKADSEVLDRFVAERLGLPYKAMVENDYFSGEQIDALALAIDNHERGGAFILGDQTGVGKGRVVAGMMMYAKRQGMTPIFVTENPGLYGDIYRDLYDISWLDFNGLPTNRDLKKSRAIPLPPEESGKVLETPKKLNFLYRQMIQEGRLPKGYDALLTTYSQLQPIGGKKTPRNQILTSLSRRAFLVLDESHEAGGTEGPPKVNKKTGEEVPTRADLIRGYVENAQGVMYSSATFAKRPQTMSLYSRTNMRLAVGKPSDLEGILESGGVPMEQVISSMLVEDAQYVRREKDFEGITIPPVPIKIDRPIAEENSRLVRTIYLWDQMVAKPREKFAAAIAAQHGGKTMEGDASQVQTTSFGSLMHNIVAQSLLAMKVDAAANHAIEAHKKGRKPIITVSNTMGAILDDYMREMGLNIGDSFGDLDFRQIYKKYLNRTIEVTLTDPFTEKKTRFRMSPDDLIRYGNPQLLKQFQEIESIIERSLVKKMPASPIDHIISRLREEGIEVGEITGRSTILDPDTGKILSRKSSAGGKKLTIAGFNSGKLDALIMNRSGSTGFSMHASEKFKDKKPRIMINAQPEANIDKYVQLLGRINRTGQVELPEYALLVGDIPAEIRPAAVLAKKLASLNANTTAARTTAITTEIELDILNKVGTEAVGTYLTAHPALSLILGLRPDTLHQDDKLVQKATGRLAILPIDEGITTPDGEYIPSQTEFYEGVAENFQDIMEQYLARGENPLEAQTMDLEAETLGTSVLAKPKPSGKSTMSIFEGEAFLEKIMANRIIKPLTGKQVLQRMWKALDLEGDPFKGDATAADVRQKIIKASPDKEAQLIVDLKSRETEYRTKLSQQIAELDELLEAQGEQDTIDSKEQKARLIKMRTRLQQRTMMLETITRKIRNLWVGAPIKVQVGSGEKAYFSTGIVIDFKDTTRAKDPLALSNFQWTIALTEGDASTMRLTGAQIAAYDPNQKPKIMLERASMAFEAIIERMERNSTVTREERFLITGNLVAGFSRVKNGAIITYTTKDGDVRQGVLLPRKFTEKDLDKLPAKLPDADHVMQYLATVGTRSIVESSDGMVQITKDNYGKTVFRFKVKGGRRLATNPVLREAIVGKKPDGELEDFFQRKLGGTSWWIGSAESIDGAKKAVSHLIDGFGFSFQTHIEKEVARNISGETDPTKKIETERLGGSTIEKTEDIKFSRFTGEFQEKQPEIVGRLQEIAKQIAPGAKVNVVENLWGEYAGRQQKLAGAYQARENLITVALDLRAENALRHESIHALRAMGLFTDKEWSALEAEAQRSWRKRYNIDQLYGNLPGSGKNEEAIAQAFADWRGGRQLAPGFRRIFDKIAQFLRRLANVLRGFGFQTFDDVFERAETGVVGRRVAKPREAAQERYFQLSAAQQRAIEAMRGKIGPRDKTWRERLGDHFETGFLDRIKAAIFDDLHGLKLLEMTANAGKLFEDARSAAKLAYLSRGIGDVVFEAMYFGAPVWDGGTTNIDTTVKAPMEILEELENLYGKEVVGEFEIYMAARRADELMEPTEKFPEGRERLFDRNEVDAGLALTEVYPEFGRAFDDFQTYNKRLLDFVQQSGLLDQRTRDLFEEMHKNYVPFYRVMEGGDKAFTKAPRARLGFAGQHPNFYRLRGGEQNIDHPLLNWERNVHRLIEASVKNVVMLRAEQLNAQTGAAFMTAKGRTALPALINNRQMIKDLQKQGLEITPEDGVNPDTLRMLWSLGNKPKGDNVVSWVRGGKVRFGEVHDPLLFRAFTMLHRKPIPLLAPFRAAKHLLTAAVGLDPSFQAANYVRDTLHASVISHIGFVPMIDSIKGMKSRIANDPHWKDFLRAGAGMSTLFEADRPSMHRVVEKHIRGKGKSKILGQIIDTPRGLIGALERAESTFEYATRVGAYRKLRAQGKSRMESAYQARQISTDFAMRGYWMPMRLLAETVPFFNAGAQGLYRTGRGAAENPWSFAVKGMLLASATAALYLINRDDERFKDMPEYERDNYWHFFVGEDHYKMPRPFEVGAIFGAIPERMIELALEREGKRFAERLQFIFLEMFRLDPIPQLVKPPLRIYANWDEFRDRPVIPSWLERMRPEEQYDSRTPLVAVETGRLLGESPKHVETLVTGYLGAMGSYAMAAGDSLFTTFGGYPQQPGSLFDRMGRPVWRRFVGQKVPNWTRSLDEFYQMKTEVDELQASLKHLESLGASERYVDLARSSARKMAMKDFLDDTNENLRQINRMMQSVRASRHLDSEAKKARLEQLQAAKNRVARVVERLRPAFAK